MWVLCHSTSIQPGITAAGSEQGPQQCPLLALLAPRPWTQHCRTPVKQPRGFPSLSATLPPASLLSLSLLSPGPRRWPFGLHVTPRSPALPLSGLTISPQKVSKGVKGGDGKWGMDQGQGKGEDREEGNSCFTEKFTQRALPFSPFGRNTVL